MSWYYKNPSCGMKLLMATMVAILFIIISYLLYLIYYILFIISYLLYLIYYILFIISYLLYLIYYILFIIFYLLYFIYYILFIISYLFNHANTANTAAKHSSSESTMKRGSFTDNRSNLLDECKQGFSSNKLDDPSHCC